MQVSESEYDWILLNVNLSGYYRVKYDQLNLKRLVHLLENDPKVRSCIWFFFFFQAYKQTSFCVFLPAFLTNNHSDENLEQQELVFVM